MVKALIAGFSMLVSLSTVMAQTTAPRLTDLLTPQEREASGLSKLSPAELDALNAALMRVFVQIESVSDHEVPSGASQSRGSLDLYDSNGRATAYVAADEDSTIYLWSGRPVAYLEGNSVYGFNGKHLGWFIKGVIYDNDGNPVAATPENFRSRVDPAPIKGLKQLKPLKELRELKPLKPIFTTD